MTLPSGKPAPVVNPKQVEPKVYLAVERTFLSWCRIGVLLGSLAVGMCAPISCRAWSDPADNAAGLGANPTFARILGAAYTLIAIGAIVYAYAMQRTRLRWIDIRHPGHHDELVGPLLLSGVLFAAVLLNFILRGQSRVDLPMLDQRHERCAC